ncbi:MAG: reverse transcriptase domain-containing protein [Planctomycetota bacterium]
MAKLSAAQAAELLHRRCHAGVDKLRSLAFTTNDVPRVLASAPAAGACVSCAAARIKRASHSTTLSAPAPEPGVLHVDLKEMVVSIGNYRYVVFAIDEYSRYTFIEFIKLKSEAADAVARIIAAFNATVYTPVDEHGRAMARPRVRTIHSDREGKLMSKYFLEFCASENVHHTTSPPHDHDLNPIAERIIGLISEVAAAVRLATDASPRLWPWIICYVVDWHNSMVSSVGSSSADSHISPHQRFTLRQPSVMDLAAFGCRAVALRPPTHQHKPSLSGRGWVGSFLGRSRYSKGCYDILVDGKVVQSSSVIVDEEHFDWAPPQKRHQPLTSVAHSARQPQHLPLRPDLPPAGSLASAPASYPADGSLRLLNLFSGPYARADGLASHLRRLGWADVEQIDNDGEHGGGWRHDLLNDETYSKLLQRAASGAYDAVMIAFPCSTFSITRFFDASDTSGADRGPPVIRDCDHPDGLPDSQIDARYIRELETSNLLLERTVNVAIAARHSAKRATIVVENPADRSVRESPCYSPKLARHGSLFATTAFKRLRAAADLQSSVTFAYCRLGAPHQKYTTLFYSAEAGSVLDALAGPDYQCNHERGTHAERAGGRGPDGSFVSAAAAAYPEQLNATLARAFTMARTGGSSVVRAPSAAAAEVRTANLQLQPPRQHRRHEPVAPPSASHGGVPPPTEPPSGGGSPPSAAPGASPEHMGREPRASPVAFPSLGSPAPASRSYDRHAHQPQLRRERRAPDRWGDSYTWADRFPRKLGAAAAPQPPQLPALSPIPSEPGSATPSSATSQNSFSPSPSTYAPFDPSSAASTMEAAVAETVFSASSAATSGGLSESQLVPLSSWVNISRIPPKAGKRLPGGARVVEVHVAVEPGDENSMQALISSLGHALRADSPGAPSTHREAVAAGDIWIRAEEKEMTNHKSNGSWVTITQDELPAGRRVHKLLWVYKVKRDGTAKARLCFNGSTLQAGIDFDQVFSAALRYSSARALFAYAARTGCRVRSIDLVAAYLQGEFMDGEVVYSSLPTGYLEYDSKGRPLIAKVVKPIYGVQQAGRRLQRLLFAWLREQGFVPLDDSDPCVFTRAHPDGEIITIGVYVDNLQIVHSVELDKDGRGPAGCAYNEFIDALFARWDVTDEGPMEDLLGIEVEYNRDGSIKLHQRKYIEKLVERFLPDGPTPKAQRGSLPYSKDFLVHVNEALSHSEPEDPSLVKPFQQLIGCLMYATTSTRPDIAYPVHQLCKCLQKPTRAVVDEAHHVLSYLARHADVGLTYAPGDAQLTGYSDASWETSHSTSGWTVLWQSAALAWGSTKQKAIALSSCEAELMALSEATKDVVYFRKLVSGLGAAEGRPTALSTDSQSARDVSYNPEHHSRMKHVQRRHFYVRDMVEALEIEVPFVRTDDNLADFFTKPLPAAKFYDMRRKIMNEPYSPARA